MDTKIDARRQERTRAVRQQSTDSKGNRIRGQPVSLLLHDTAPKLKDHGGHVCTPPCTCILKHTHSCIFMHTDDTYHTNRTRKCTCVLTITQTQVCINVTGTHIVMSPHSHTHKESWVTCLLRPRLVRMCALCQLESKSLSVNARSEPAAQVSWESTESPRPPLTL